MSKYSVKRYIEIRLDVEVEAENEMDAIKLADEDLAGLSINPYNIKHYSPEVTGDKHGAVVDKWNDDKNNYDLSEKVYLEEDINYKEEVK